MTDLLDAPILTDVAVPTDLPPDEGIGIGSALACETCGKPLTYAGRGRKPRFCDEHKKGAKGSGKSTANRSNRVLAEQAADALVQVNSLVAMLCLTPVLRMPATGTAISAAEDGFREQAVEALTTDPKLCRTILKAGTTSGRMALVIAYGMLGVAVAPVAYMELQQKRAEAEALAAEQSDSVV